MANSNQPFGLRPYSYLSGSPYNGATKMFYVPSTDNTAVFVGDTVKLAGTEGSLYAGDLPVPTVTRCTAGDFTVGVVTSIVPIPTNLAANYRVASTGMYVNVCIDPNVVYLLQGDVDTYDAADVGYNMTLTMTAGNTTTGTSAVVADQNTAAVTSSLDVQVIGTAPIPGNDLTGGYPLLLVRLNLPQYAEIATGL
jgi:hypothetical protein